MKRIALHVLFGVLTAGVLLAQSSVQTTGSASQGGTVSLEQLGAKSGGPTSAPGKTQSAPAGSANEQIQAGSIIYAELDKSVDAKKAKVGDQVIAKVQQSVLSKGKVVAPKGSKILGRVTQVKARGKGQEHSELGLAFDRIVLKDRSEIPVSMTIQAIGSGRTAALFAQDNDASMAGPMSGSPGMPGRTDTGILGASAGTVGDVAQRAGTAAGGVADATTPQTAQVGAGTATHVSASSHGVVGMPDLTLSAAAGDSTEVITSDKKNVKLDSGSELVLRVQ
jgi:hypothetical protein